MPLDDETRLRIFKDWNDGMSGGAIGQKYKMSRSAIVGLISRARSAGVELRGERTPVPEGEVRLPTRRPPRRPPTLAALPPSKAPMINRPHHHLREVVKQDPEKRWVPIWELGDHTCRFINGDGLYCNENTSRGSWCNDHHVRMTQPLIR